MSNPPQDPRLALVASAGAQLSTPQPADQSGSLDVQPTETEFALDAIAEAQGEDMVSDATDSSPVDDTPGGTAAPSLAEVPPDAPALFMPSSPEAAEQSEPPAESRLPQHGSAAETDTIQPSVSGDLASMLSEESTAPPGPFNVADASETIRLLEAGTAAAMQHEPQAMEAVRAREILDAATKTEQVTPSLSGTPTRAEEQRGSDHSSSTPVPGNQATGAAVSIAPLRFPLPAKPGMTPNAKASPPVKKSQSPHVPPHEDRATAPPARRAAQSRAASLKQTVENDPGNGEAWLELIADAEKKGDLEKTREVYDVFLEHFPDAAPQWVSYAKLELEHGNFSEVEKIFSRCLRNSVSVELWAFYLNYIRRINPIEGENASKARSMITQAYEFSLNHIGMDRESGAIWMDYITLIKSGDASGTWQEQQKMDALRKIYQRAVCVPLDKVEQIWRDYDQFENTMSKMTAKKFLGERSPQYMTARSALREMKGLVAHLHRPKVPMRPSWRSSADQAHIEGWKAYLAWEERNPLDLDDQTALQGRQQYAYKQAIMHMRFFPEIWLLLAAHLQKRGKTDEALTQLRSGLTANSASVLLTFAVADQEEARSNAAESYKVYDALISRFTSEVDEATMGMDEAIAAAQEARGGTGGAKKEANGMDAELSEEEQQRAKQEEELRERITAEWTPKIDSLKLNLGHVWIAELRFAYRAEGIKAARGVFSKARASTHKTRQIFEASAMMEYHQNKATDVAKNIFKLGLTTFGEDVAYILGYLNFLLSLNDEPNARALFEKTVSKLSPEVARPLWDRWAAYEYEYGDAAAILKLEARMAELLPDTSATDRFVQRHLIFGHAGALDKDLGRNIFPPSMSSDAAMPGARSPSPVPAHLQGFGFKAVNGGPGVSASANGPLPPAVGIPPRPKVRERSYSPDGRGKRQRGNFRERSPPPRGRPGPPPGPTRGRYDSPPPREDPYAWFPEAVRFFLGVLPSAHAFDGPRLDPATVMQVLSDADLTSGRGGGRPPPGGPAGWGGRGSRGLSPPRRRR